MPIKNLNKTISKLLEVYAAKGCFFDIKRTVNYLSGNRAQLRVKILPQTRVADIEKHANDVRLALKLDFLKVYVEPNAVYIVVSRELEDDEHLLKYLWGSPEYIEMRKVKSLACPIGVDDLGKPVIFNMADNRYPHAVVSGTSGAGKSVAMNSLIMSLLRYPPWEVNLLIGDMAHDLSQFVELPHLSYPLIEDFDTLLKILLVLKDEMDRRISLKNTPQFEQLPFIVVMIDEFNSFMSAAPDKGRLDLTVDALAQLLRRGRHARIHFVLAAHDPTKDNMKINTSDLPVKMVFRVSNLHNSVTALGEGGAEKLRGNGDMLFKGSEGVQHLQGAYISPTDIDSILQYIRNNSHLSIQQTSTPWKRLSPRGINGFTITEAALHRKEEELCAKQIRPSFRSSTKTDSELLFASVAAWALGQDEISCNQISEGFSVGWRRANELIMWLHDFGIVGNLDAKLPRKVLLHSVEEVPQIVQDLLHRYGISE